MLGLDPHRHTGADNGVPRVGLPPTYYSDGPVGPRQGQATAMPAPMGVAATFDPSLARLAAGVIGSEARSKGNDVVFAPTVNIMRTPLGGRTFESYGEDPHLVTRMTVEAINGLQAEGVIANVKHFAANNQEGYGGPAANLIGRPGVPLGVGGEGNRFIVESQVDERTLREIYLPQFEAAVKEANVGSVMCSYNRLNGPWACENGFLLEQILRREWGFKGYVIADYGAAHQTIPALENGLDFEPFPPLAYQPLLISAAVGSGLVPRARVDEHARSILRTLFAFGFFDRGVHVDDDAQIDKREHGDRAQRIAEAAITLLKNERALLPLERKWFDRADRARRRPLQDRRRLGQRPPRSRRSRFEPASHRPRDRGRTCASMTAPTSTAPPRSRGRATSRSSRSATTRSKVSTATASACSAPISRGTRTRSSSGSPRRTRARSSSSRPAGRC